MARSNLWQYLAPYRRVEWEVQVTDIRAVIVGGLLVGICACGGGGGSPNPALGNLAFTTNENVTLNGALTAKDPGGSAVTFTKTSDPKSGTLTFAADGTFTYVPAANFTGSDSFGIQAADTAGNESTGSVSINVTMNHPPTANDAILTSDGTDLGKLNVLQNVMDQDKDTLTVTIVEPPPAPASATVNDDGTVKIAGLSGFKGLTRFTYQVTDPSGAAATWCRLSAEH